MSRSRLGAALGDAGRNGGEIQKRPEERGRVQATGLEPAAAWGRIKSYSTATYEFALDILGLFVLTTYRADQNQMLDNSARTARRKSPAFLPQGTSPPGWDFVRTTASVAAKSSLRKAATCAAGLPMPCAWPRPLYIAATLRLVTIFARELHLDNAVIEFNLTCYASVACRFEEAKERLKRAVGLDRQLPEMDPAPGTHNQRLHLSWTSRVTRFLMRSKSPMSPS